MKQPETADEVFDQFITNVRPLIDRTRTNKLLRQAMLNDPMTVLKNENIYVTPGIEVRFYETKEREVALPLPFYEGKD